MNSLSQCDNGEVGRDARTKGQTDSGVNFCCTFLKTQSNVELKGVHVDSLSLNILRWTKHPSSAAQLKQPIVSWINPENSAHVIPTTSLKRNKGHKRRLHKTKDIPEETEEAEAYIIWEQIHHKIICSFLPFGSQGTSESVKILVLTWLFLSFSDFWQSLGKRFGGRLHSPTMFTLSLGCQPYKSSQPWSSQLSHPCSTYACFTA